MTYIREQSSKEPVCDATFVFSQPIMVSIGLSVEEGKDVQALSLTGPVAVQAMLVYGGLSLDTK